MRHTGDLTDGSWKVGRNIPEAVVDGRMGRGWELPAILTQRKLFFLRNIDGNRSLRRWLDGPTTPTLAPVRHAIFPDSLKMFMVSPTAQAA
jgi:hypothetical protein